MNKEILLNDFATRSFRNIADQDYIAARLCYRNNLIPQFHWQSLQAIEKYLKAILLYNRIKATNINHNLSSALKLTKKLPFELDLSDSTKEFIKHLDNFGRFRYLETSYFIRGYKLVELDKAVWEIRRYCRTLNYEVEKKDGTTRNMLDLEIDKINRSSHEPPHKFKITNGDLEKIIKKKSHPSREALLWQNLFFSTKHRKTVRANNSIQAVNSPLYMHPEIVDDVLEYVFLPKGVVRAFKEVNKSSKINT